jgi:hypothetical protein
MNRARKIGRRAISADTRAICVGTRGQKVRTKKNAAV